MSNPWDIPPLSEFDNTADIVYLSVGKALSCWEELEHQLACFFGFFATTGSDDDIAARRAYGSVLTFRGRADMNLAAAEVFFSRHPDEELSKRFSELIKIATKFSPRRNEVAHGIVRIAMKPDGEFGWYLGPSEYATNKNELVRARPDQGPETVPRYLYSSREINAFASSFQGLTKSAIQLMFDWGDKDEYCWPVPHL